MKTHFKEINGYRIEAADGLIGKVKDFLFDDEQWVARYLVVDTGAWLPGRKVLIAPEAFGAIDRTAKRFHVNLTKEKVQNSPSILEHLPVAREHEYELNQYYGWNIYWADGPFIVNPAYIEPDLKKYGGEEHLRSFEILNGFHIHALDGEIGHIDDFTMDEATWKILGVIVDTRNWVPGKKVEIESSHLKTIHLHDRKIDIDLKKADVLQKLKQ